MRLLSTQQSFLFTHNQQRTIRHNSENQRRSYAHSTILTTHHTRINTPIEGEIAFCSFPVQWSAHFKPSSLSPKTNTIHPHREHSHTHSFPHTPIPHNPSVSKRLVHHRPNSLHSANNASQHTRLETPVPFQNAETNP